MNTKIASVLIALFATIAITGSASAAVYDLNADYTYLDQTVGEFDANTMLNAELTGKNVGNNPFFMHSMVSNSMDVKNLKVGPDTDVAMGLMQGGGNSLTIGTGTGPDGHNMFESSATAVQAVGYESTGGNIYNVEFQGYSLTHESTHYGILPITVGVYDSNWATMEATTKGDAAIKSGNFGYRCDSNAMVEMEDEVVKEALGGTGLLLWLGAEGEFNGPNGMIAVRVEDAGETIHIDWSKP